MTQNIASAKTTMLSTPSLDVVTPLSSRTLFWRPRFLRESEALHHLPFLFWLIDVLRPKSFVTLGGDDGVMHFALCQAVEKLDLDARGYGVGPWPDGQLPAALRAHNDDQYPDLSRLFSEGPAAAAGRVPQGAIDLLLVRMDGQTDEAELADMVKRDWLQRLSARGVLLVHGATETGAEGGFLAQMIAQHPSFRFDSGSGLVLIQYGNQPEDRLEKLCQIGLGDAGYAGILQVFSRLGGAVRTEMTARQEGERTAKLSATLDEAMQNLQQARVSEAEQAAEIARLAAVYEERNQQVAALQARLIDMQSAEVAHQRAIFDLEAQATAARDTIAGLSAERVAFSQALSAKDAELTTLWSNLEQSLQDQELAEAREQTLQTELAATQAAHAAQIAGLSNALLALETEATGARDAIANLVADNTALSNALLAKDADLAALAANLEQLLQDQEAARARELALQAHAAALKDTLTLQEQETADLLTAQRAQAMMAEQRYEDLNRQMRALSVERDAIADLLEQREALAAGGHPAK